MAPGSDIRRVHRGTVETGKPVGEDSRLPALQPEPREPPPLDPPQVDPDLHDLSAVERMAEVLRYSLLSLEHAISQDGLLRRWLLRVLRIGAFLGIPVLVLLPLTLVLLHGIAGCIRLLHEIALHAFLSGLVIGLVLLAVLIVLRLAGIGRR